VLRQPIESALTAVIGMEYHARQTASQRVGGVQGIGNQFGAHVIGDRPPRNTA